ncbi:MAG: HYR domain-containing protein [Saprospiraceae bacterium]|nr:HYR domain-containing protein [Saprospiraceae bacterium]
MGECSVTVTAPTTTDVCAGTIAGTTTDPLTYSTQGTYTITWTFNDGNGNSTTAMQTVIVDDVTAPVTPTIANATGECSVTVTAPTTTDVCAGTITGTTTNPLTYNTQGTFTITWTFNDGNGNSTTAMQTVIVDDVTPPVITCAANVTVNTAAGLCTASGVTLTPPTVSDNCPSTSNNALAFDGVDDHITMGDVNAVDGISQMTIEAWVYRTNTSGFNSIVNKTFSQSGDIGIQLHLFDPNDVYFRLASGSDAFGYTTGNQIPINSWVHIAAVFDGTATGNANRVKIYINGVQKTLSFLGTIPSVTPNTTAPLQIAFPSPGAQYWNGKMDEVRIWTTARTSTQILSNFNSELNAQAGLLALYHFNQGVAGGNNVGITSVIDASGNGLNGTLTNSALTGSTSNWVTGLLSGSSIPTNDAPITYPIGITSVTWSANDGNGNTATCTQTVTVVDNQAPVTPTIANATGECSVTVTAPTTTDVCAGTITGTTTNPLTYSTQGTYTITWTFNDGNGNSTTANQTVIVDDVTAPVITCAPGISVNTTLGLCTATALLSYPTMTDNCVLPGLLGNALSFDGLNDHTERSPLTGLSSADFTFEFWFKANSLSSFPIFFSQDKSFTSTPAFRAEIGSTSQNVRFFFNSASGSVTNSTPNNTVSANAWTHYAIVRTGNTFRSYINGVLQTTTVASGSPTLVGNNFNFRLGARYSNTNGLTNLFNGALDEFRCWNVARTQSQIQASMNNSLISASGLYINYPFNQGVAGGNNTGINTLNDLSGSNLNSTLNNFALAGNTSNFVAGNTSSSSFTNNAPTVFPIGNTTVVWTGTDASGNISTCSQLVTVRDNQAPTAICHPSLSVGLTNDGTAVINAQMLNNNISDLCGPVSLSINTGISSFTCLNYGVPYIVTLRVTDAAGNTSTCASTIVLTAGSAPDFDTDSVPDCFDQDDDNDGILDIHECIPASAINFETQGTFGSVSSVQKRRNLESVTGVQYQYASSGQLNSKWYAVTSQEGNAANRVHSNTILWPAELRGHTTGTTNDAFMAVNGSTVSSQIFFTRSVSLLPNTVYDYGAWASNANRLGQGAPTIGIRIRNASNTIVHSISSGTSIHNVGIQWKEQKGTFNTGSGTQFTIELFNISISGGGNDFSVDDIFVRLSNAQNCNVDGDGFVNSLDLDSDGDGCYDVFEAGLSDGDNNGILGTSPVTVSANGLVIGYGGYSGPSNAAQNAGINACCTVITPPSFVNCPTSPIQVGTSAIGCDAIANYVVTTLGSPAPTLSYSLSGATFGAGTGTGSGSVLNLGNTIVTITAGICTTASATCTFTVTVSDNQPPIFACPADMTVNLPSGGSSDAILVAERGGSALSRINLTTNTRTVVASINAADGIVIENSTHVLISRHSNSGTTIFRVNRTTGAQTPIASLGGQCQGMSLDGLGNVYVVNEGLGRVQKVNLSTSVFTNVAIGLNRPADVVFENSNTLLISLYNLGRIIRYNLTTNASAILSIGHVAPTDIFNEGNGNILVAENGGALSRVNLITGVRSVLINLGGGPFGPHGISKDASGNMYVAIYSGHQIKKVSPANVLLATYNTGNNPVFIAFEPVTPACGASVTYNIQNASDNCTLNGVSLSPPSGSLFPVGSNIVTATATDAAGNASTCTFNVMVRETQAPTFTSCPSNQTVTATTGCTAPVTYITPVATGNCTTPTVSLISGLASGSTFPQGPTVVRWHATDNSGNTSTCSFTVTVQCAPAQLGENLEGRSNSQSSNVDLEISPNPAISQVKLLPKAYGMEDNSTGKLSIFDAQGRLIWEQSALMNEVMNLDISTWSRGVYLVRMETSKGRVNKPLIIIE